MNRRSACIWGSISCLAATLTLARQPATQPDEMPTTAPTTMRGRAPIHFNRPPPSGAPRGEATAGSRGPEDSLPVPIPFAENDEPGLTITPQPRVYFYIPAPTPNPAVVSVSDPQDKRTLAEIRFDHGFAKAGIYSADLAGTKASLQPDVTYLWVVAIRSTKKDGAHNALALALIRYQPMPEVSRQIEKMSAENRARVLAENSIWYDSMDALCQAIDQRPDDQFLRDQRIQMLKGEHKVGADTFERPPGN